MYFYTMKDEFFSSLTAPAPALLGNPAISSLAASSYAIAFDSFCISLSRASLAA